MPTQIEYAWAAGFIEGEGCFSETATTRALTVTQVRLEPLKKLQSILGGIVRGPYEPHGIGRKPYYRYYLGASKLRKQIGGLWPHLCDPKRAQYLQGLSDKHVQWVTGSKRNKIHP